MYLGNQNYVLTNRRDLTYNYTKPCNPTTNINPPLVNSSWLNTETSELFICSDNTKDANVWEGCTGTYITAGGVNPEDISELEALWRVEDLPLTHKSAVTSWSSCVNNHIFTDNDSTVTAPKYMQMPDGKPFVQFLGYDVADAKGVGLTLGSDYIYADNFKTGMTLFAVCSSFAGGDGFLLTFGSGQNAYYAMNVNDSSIAGGCSIDYGGVVLGATNLKLLTPVFVVVVIEFKTAIKSYMNGISIDSAAITLSQLTANEISESTTRRSSGGPVALGCQSKMNNTDDERSFYGNLYEIGIFTKALSDEEISGLMLHYKAKYNLRGGL